MFFVTEYSINIHLLKSWKIKFPKCTHLWLVQNINKVLFCLSGDLENEDEILEWLVAQLEKDEIEDVTDEMLDRLIKEGKTIAVLFCKN